MDRRRKVILMYDIEKSTECIIRQLYNKGAMDKAALSALRSSSRLDGNRAQKVWPVFLSNLNEKYLSKTGKATRAEMAVFVAVRMYALHQQSSDYCVFARKRYSSADVTGVENGLELFEVLNQLSKVEESRVALERRVQALLGTTNFTAAVDQLIHLMQIVKGKKLGIRIDYARLAGDLYRFQLGYRQANEVRLHWGEQYYRA